MVKITRISNTGNAWAGVEMSLDEFKELLGVLTLSNYQHTIVFENNGVKETLVLNEVKYVSTY